MNFSTKGAWALIRQSNEPKELLKRLWHNSIPLKCSVLAWRIIGGMIASDDIIKKRFAVALPSKCQCCHEEESREHVFLTNPMAQKVWRHFCAYFNLPNVFYPTVNGLLSSWFNSHDWVEYGHIRILIPILILNSLWTARNESKHMQHSIQAERVIIKTEQQIWSLVKAGLIRAENCRGEGAFCKKFGISMNHKSNEGITIFKWVKPAVGVYKLNIDGSSHGNPGPAAAGGILRDYCGKVIFTFQWPLGTQPAFIAEAAAAKEGLKICNQIGIRKVWIESDSAQLVNQINHRSNGNWQSFPYLSKIRTYLQAMEWTCSHIWREGNQAADWLANRGVRLSVPSIELHSPLHRRLKGIIRCDAAELEQIRVPRLA